MPYDVAPGETTRDAALGGRLRLRQPRRGHRFGHDGVLLAAIAPAETREHAVDLGAGVGIAGLALARRCPNLRVTLVERDPSLVALAQENAAENGLADRVRAVALDVGAATPGFAAAGLRPECADAVLMNPPFNPEARFAASPHPAREEAHVAAGGLLAEWVRAAHGLLRPGGALAVIWRAEGLGDVVAALGSRFGDLAVLPVHPKPHVPAIRVLVRARKGSRAPLSLLPGLVLNDAAGRPTVEAERVLRDAEPLPLP